MVKLIKKYTLAVAVILLLTVIIIIRNSGTGRFKYDAVRRAVPSYTGTNIITPENVSSLSGQLLIIDLDKEASDNKGLNYKVIKVMPESLLTQKYRRIIFKNNGPVLLSSDDFSISAKTWMILSQSGLKDLYILTENPDNEIGKEKFRPDSVEKPEF